MPAGTFPVPKDVRTARSFTIVKGVHDMHRTSVALTTPSDDVDVGEWMAIDSAGTAVKATSAAIITAPLQGARASWTLYRQGDSNAGQSDAMSTGMVDLLSGPYQAKTQLYNTGSTWTAGAPVVVIWDSVNSRGVLAPLDPTTCDSEQMAAVVGQVVVVPTGGVLHYESK
ncbi:MAG: hypothetical protein DRP42_00630 [Tenericutes bacterium]|nr:MAG: hypothetical protein DRP42_00630 [Mycoplasmatota bacterium]